MATRLYLHSPLLLVIAVITGCVSEYPQRTIQVSESGQNRSSCLGQLHACKTLAYVWDMVKKDTFFLPYSAEISELLINVMYNQTIPKTLKVTLLNFEYIKKVSVVGYNNAFINFEHAGTSIQILQFSGIRWSWIGLGFAWVGQSTIHNVYQIPKIVMSLQVYALEVCDCKFVSVSLYSKSTQGLGIVINNNVFGNSAFCPTVSLIVFDPATIANNTFENCQHNSFTVLDIQVHNHSIKIVNNSFANLKVKDYSYRSVISVNGAPAGILIQKNQFIGNSMSSIAIDAVVYNEAFIGNHCTWCNMQDNNFQSNHFLPTGIKQEPILVSVKARIFNRICPMEFVFDQNSFKNNTRTRLLTTEVISQNNLLHNIITITALTVSNNNGTSGLVIIKNNDPLHQNIWVNLTFLKVENNTSLYEEDTSESLEATIVYFKNANRLIIRDSNFQNNLGTSLVFENEQVNLDLCLMGDLLFDANTGIHGGAMSLYSVAINSSCQSTIMFKENYAVYGGALYLENSQGSCVCPGAHACLTTLEFIDNRATTSGNSVYFATSSSDFDLDCKNFSMKDDVGSAANSIMLHSRDRCSLSIFPGQNIIVNISITDQFNQSSLCTAGVLLLCNEQIYTCFDQHIKLSGPASVVLVQPPDTNSSIIDTNLVLQSPNHNESRNILLNLSCKESNTSIKITLNISACPQGFLYNSKLNVCKCAKKTDHTVCSTVLGAVCVSHGYWYGQVGSDYIVARCKYSECKVKNAPCPPGMQSDSNYFLLNGTQCSNGRGGVLCRICAKHYVFSFLSIHCIPEENCSSSKAVAILFFGILFQILITIFLVLVVRFKHSLGCGFLYGPMLFLAVVNHIPLDDYSEYSTLSTVVSIITSVALLNLELFGRIPWCFFASFPKLYNYSLRVLGPLTVLLVLLGITALARWHPKCSLFEKVRMRILPQSLLQRWHASRFRTTYLQLSPLSVIQSWLASPLKAMCILMMLSFWSLADISINILTPTVFETQHKSMFMVSIQPNITFFSSEHLPLAIPALLVLLVVIFPLLVVLLSAPFLQHMINLFKIKPFLDEFQSCYKDKYRWYSGVYFVVWIVIVGVQGLPDSLLYTQTIFFILLCAQFLIKPYKSKLLNITDTLLLVDLNFLIALLYKHINSPLSSHKFLSFLVHALIIVPFVCAAVSLICLLLIKYGVYDCVKGFWSRRKRGPQELQQQPQDGEHVFELSHPQVPVQEVHVPDVSANIEREPLIAIVDNQL